MKQRSITVMQLGVNQSLNLNRGSTRDCTIIPIGTAKNEDKEPLALFLLDETRDKTPTRNEIIEQLQETRLTLIDLNATPVTIYGIEAEIKKLKGASQ